MSNQRNRKGNHQGTFRAFLAPRRWVVGAGTILLAALMLYQFQVETRLSREIVYQPSSPHWEELMQAEEKWGLALLYVPYCYPCQLWEKEMTKHPTFAHLINQKFLNFRINALDAYTGGVDIAAKFEVNTFPTYLVLDQAGQAVARFSPQSEDQEDWMAWLTSFDPQGAPSITQHTLSHKKLRKGSVQTPSYGLLVKEVPTWQEGQALIRAYEKSWSRDTWMQPGKKGKFGVVLGTFQKREEAKKAKALLRVMDQIPSEVVRLKADPLEIYESQVSEDQASVNKYVRNH